MRFLLDENLSHTYLADFAAAGYPDTIHPLNVGMRGSRDDTILARALAEDRVIVTMNAKDFRKLLSRTELHAGAIFLEALDRDAALKLIHLALAFIELQPQPDSYMVNRVLEVSRTTGIQPYDLPEH